VKKWRKQWDYKTISWLLPVCGHDVKSWSIYSCHHRNGVYVSCISMFIKTMGKLCVAFDCSNIPGKGVSLFKFPNNLALRAEWTRQVQRNGADFKDPTKNFFACSEHFTKDCFEKDTELAASFGIKKQRRLIDGAIPTIFKRPEAPTPSTSQSPSLKVAPCHWNELLLHTTKFTSQRRKEELMKKERDLE